MFVIGVNCRPKVVVKVIQISIKGRKTQDNYCPVLHFAGLSVSTTSFKGFRRLHLVFSYLA